MNIEFPDPETAQEDGIVCFTKEINSDYLRSAYPKGIFPWPIEGLDFIPWFCPEKRGILFFDEIKISRRDKSLLRNHPFKITNNFSTVQVIENCAKVPRAHQPGTWITPELIQAYSELANQGFCQSVETWMGSKLVGGIYGVQLGGYFSAESMFYKESGASKIALLTLIEQLRTLGQKWLDIQMVTPHLKKMGAREINRSEFLRLIRNNRE